DEATATTGGVPVRRRNSKRAASSSNAIKSSARSGAHFGSGSGSPVLSPSDSTPDEYGLYPSSFSSIAASYNKHGGVEDETGSFFGDAGFSGDSELGDSGHHRRGSRKPKGWTYGVQYADSVYSASVSEATSEDDEDSESRYRAVHHLEDEEDEDDNHSIIGSRDIFPDADVGFRDDMFAGLANNVLVTKNNNNHLSAAVSPSVGAPPLSSSSSKTTANTTPVPSSRSLSVPTSPSGVRDRFGKMSSSPAPSGSESVHSSPGLLPRSLLINSATKREFSRDQQSQPPTSPLSDVSTLRGSGIVDHRSTVTATSTANASTSQAIGSGSGAVTDFGKRFVDNNLVRKVSSIADITNLIAAMPFTTSPRTSEVGRPSNGSVVGTSIRGSVVAGNSGAHDARSTVGTDVSVSTERGGGSVAGVGVGVGGGNGTIAGGSVVGTERANSVIIHSGQSTISSVASSSYVYGNGLRAEVQLFATPPGHIPTVFYRHGVYIGVSQISTPERKGKIDKMLNGYTQYTLTVKLLRPGIPLYGNSAACTFTVYRRYREFRSFYQELVKKYRKLISGWPEFPKKSFFDRFHPDTIQHRISSFATLFTFVCLHPQLYNSPIVLNFLGVAARGREGLGRGLDYPFAPGGLVIYENGSSSSSSSSSLATVVSTSSAMGAGANGGATVGTVGSIPVPSPYGYHPYPPALSPTYNEQNEMMKRKMRSFSNPV
ncbi:hypothetical protein HK102_007267, partial [Quaeritorhiza haematococci]